MSPMKGRSGLVLHPPQHTGLPVCCPPVFEILLVFKQTFDGERNKITQIVTSQAQTGTKQASVKTSWGQQGCPLPQATGSFFHWQEDNGPGGWSLTLPQCRKTSPLSQFPTVSAERGWDGWGLPVCSVSGSLWSILTRPRGQGLNRSQNEGSHNLSVSDNLCPSTATWPALEVKFCAIIWFLCLIMKATHLIKYSRIKEMHNLENKASLSPT